MRELWKTGVMHNRARMICASFLTKHLLIDWREGEAWFWDTLIDADAANNAGELAMGGRLRRRRRALFPHFQSGVAGREIRSRRRLCPPLLPGLSGLPAKVIHWPWTAPASVLADAGVRLGRDFPEPIVDHDFARGRALDGFLRFIGLNGRRPCRPSSAASLIVMRQSPSGTGHENHLIGSRSHRGHAAREIARGLRRDRLRDFGQGGIPESRRLDEGPRGAGHRPGREASAACCKPGGRHRRGHGGQYRHRPRSRRPCALATAP